MGPKMQEVAGLGAQSSGTAAPEIETELEDNTEV